MSEKEDRLLGGETKSYVKFTLNLLFLLAILSTSFLMVYRFTIPTPIEYDDPDTADIQESFPWNPNILSNSTGVLKLFFMGFLRHIALLPQNVGTIELISMVGNVFLVLFIYSIRKTFLASPSLGIHNYVEWGIGSIVGAIIYIAGTNYVRREIDVGIAVILLSVACLVLYIVHPRSELTKRIRTSKRKIARIMSKGKLESEVYVER